MSAIRVLASELAYARADHEDRAGYFALSGKESPIEARDMLLAYCHLLDTSKRVRAEMAAAREPLRAQVIAKLLQDEIEDAIASHKRYLSRIARRGGRGVFVARHEYMPGAGRSPANAVGVSMAHGCAASSSAVGPALRAGQGGEVAPPADPLLSCQQWQDLPVVAATDNTQSRVGGGISHDIRV